MSNDPTFASEISTWLDNPGHEEIIQQMNKESGINKLEIERLKIKKELELQEKLRPRLREIPGFWPYTLYRNLGFSRFCNSADDLSALSYLTDVELKIDPEDPREYSIVFTFKENPYFSDTTLTKSYVLVSQDAGSSSKAAANGNITDEQLEFDADEDLKASKTPIHWKSDEVNLCKKHPRQMVVDEEDDEDLEGDFGSFFWWFDEEHDQFEIGDLLLTNIIPNCIDNFLGSAEGCGSDDDFSVDEEDDEEEDEIDLEEEEKRPRKKAKTEA